MIKQVLGLPAITIAGLEACKSLGLWDIIAVNHPEKHSNTGVIDD
jgi:hypothetical protein